VVALLAGLIASVGLAACATSTIPSKYVRQAEQGVTLTDLKQRPDVYKGKVVILGGAIVEKRQEPERIWLLVRNRPVDEDFVPHVPPSMEGDEAGYYWVALTPQGLPPSYQGWARITVVGRISDEPHPEFVSITNPDIVLVGLYVRGWGGRWGGYGIHQEAWEETRPASSIMTTPKSILRSGQGQ
jgi:starvation-inducible outer membrane lipoprotein